MSIITEEAEHYRKTLRFLADFLWTQSSNDAFILELIKGDDLPDFEATVRAFVDIPR